MGFEGMGRERERERLFLLLTASLGLESEGACCRTTRHIAVRETAITTFNTLRNCGCILEQSVPPNVNARGDLVLPLRRGNGNGEPGIEAPKLPIAPPPSRNKPGLALGLLLRLVL